MTGGGHLCRLPLTSGAKARIPAFWIAALKRRSSTQLPFTAKPLLFAVAGQPKAAVPRSAVLTRLCLEPRFRGSFPSDFDLLRLGFGLFGRAIFSTPLCSWPNLRFWQSTVVGRVNERVKQNYRRVERQYGSFTRTFTLPQTVDTENVSATYDKGVLNITLPKKAEAKPKQIKVNVGSGKQIESKGPSKAA